MEWTDALGWVGTALFLVRLLPQPLKLHRTGDTAGVSVQSALNALVSDAGWLVHGLVTGLAPVWVAAIAALPLDVWMLWHLRGRIEVRHLSGAALWAAALAIGGAVWGRAGLGVVLGTSVVVNHAPQVWTALRSHSLSGLAPATWCFALADALLWGGYGWAERDPALIAYGLVLGAASVTILTAIALRHPSRHRPPT
jgi:uncharacterized protein with PQ loop repeat